MAVMRCTRMFASQAYAVGCLIRKQALLPLDDMGGN
jgi:hypothetical protein